MINIIYAALYMRPQTEKTTFSGKDDCTLSKHTRRWTFSALRYFFYLVSQLLVSQRGYISFSLKSGNVCRVFYPKERCYCKILIVDNHVQVMGLTRRIHRGLQRLPQPFRLGRAGSLVGNAG